MFKNGEPQPRLRFMTLLHMLLFTHPTDFRVFLNIGEIATLSFFSASADHSNQPALFRHCGPGSLLIDYNTCYFAMHTSKDRHDSPATQGKVHQNVVDRFLDALDYLRIAPDMSMATEMFGSHEAQDFLDECYSLRMSETDTLATIARVTAQSIVKQYRRLLRHRFGDSKRVDQLYIYGAGSRNSDVVDYIRKELPESIIKAPADGLELQSHGYEPILDAQLAFEVIFGQALQCSAASSSENVWQCVYAVGGRVVCGAEWSKQLGKLTRNKTEAVRYCEEHTNSDRDDHRKCQSL